MAIALEFINLVIRIDRIEQKYPGGVHKCLADHGEYLGGRVWHDQYLFRDGAMNPNEIQEMVGFWTSLGFEGAVVQGTSTLAWVDFCVLSSNYGSSSSCSWLSQSQHPFAVRFINDKEDLLVGRDPDYSRKLHEKHFGSLIVSHLALAYVEELNKRLFALSRPLSELECAWALDSGVQHIEQVRVVELPEIPQPSNQQLAEMARKQRFLSSATVGITLDHLIIIKRGYWGERLMRHELRHVHQWEQAQSLHHYLTEYLTQIYTHGYDAAPFEKDARLYESHHSKPAE